MNISKTIASMIDVLENDLSTLTPAEQRELVLTNSKKDLSQIDLIWTTTGAACCVAVASGWSYGFRSSDDLCLFARKQGRHYPIFIDNNFHEYDHLKHLKVIKKYKPKYCTVRDMMTREQCLEAGISYYSPEQILAWAYELKEYAHHVMIIPKHEKYLKFIDPKNFMIGYSVPSSYGGTPIPITEFGDWRIHLLGGSINRQIAYWAEMPDNVVSLDNNSLHLASCKGTFWTMPGNMYSLKDLAIRGEKYTAKELGFTSMVNVQHIAIAISLGSVATYFGRMEEKGRNRIGNARLVTTK